MSAPISAVLPAAGSSRRLGFDKLLTPVAGVSFLEHTLRRVAASPLIAEIIVVTSAASQEAVQAIIQEIKITQPVKVILGGAERQDSVLAGVEATDPRQEFVLIHDAARPFVTPALVEKVWQAAQAHGAAVCGQPCTDTLKEANPDGSIAATVDRSKIWSVQTPQIFRRALLLEAYQKIKASGQIVTDDTAAVSALGHPVQLVQSDEINLKITRASDWHNAIHLLVALDDDVKATAEMRKLIHDISNQITSVMGFSFLIDMDCAEDSSIKDHVKALNDSSQKCHGIIGAMQTSARDYFAKKTEMLHALNGQVTEPAMKH